MVPSMATGTPREATRDVSTNAGTQKPGTMAGLCWNPHNFA